MSSQLEVGSTQDHSPASPRYGTIGMHLGKMSVEEVVTLVSADTREPLLQLLDQHGVITARLEEAEQREEELIRNLGMRSMVNADVRVRDPNFRRAMNTFPHTDEVNALLYNPHTLMAGEKGRESSTGFIDRIYGVQAVMALITHLMQYYQSLEQKTSITEMNLMTCLQVLAAISARGDEYLMRRHVASIPFHVAKILGSDTLLPPEVVVQLQNKIYALVCGHSFVHHWKPGDLVIMSRDLFHYRLALALEDSQKLELEAFTRGRGPSLPFDAPEVELDPVRSMEVTRESNSLMKYLME